MRQQRKKLLSIFVMLFFLGLLLCETTYYQYESISRITSFAKEEAKIGNMEAIQSLLVEFLPRQTLDSRATLAHIEQNMSARVRFGSIFLFLMALVSFVIETKKGQQEHSLCRFRTFFQNILNILHRRDGKKGGFFLYYC